MSLSADERATAANLLDTFLSGRNLHTARAYRRDLIAFAQFLQVELEEAVGELLAADQGRANLLAMGFKARLKATGKSAATVNRRLAALVSLLKTARVLGLTSCTVEVRRERMRKYRDTAGPPVEKVKALMVDLAMKAKGGSHKAVRDLAITRLLFNLGLRGHEVVGLDLKHYDADNHRLHILGKGCTEREWTTLSPKAEAALKKWLVIRDPKPGPTKPGPLFLSVSLGRGKIRQARCRLWREDLFRMLVPYGIRPHGLRHSAITTALEVTGGNLVEVQRFSRHMNPTVLMSYDDNRRDVAGKVAGLLDKLA